MSVPKPVWSPTSILYLPNSDFCVGWTDRDNLHCGTKLQYAQSFRVLAIITKMQDLPPHSAEVHELMTELAMCGLCQAHEDQHEDIIKEWRMLTRLHHRTLAEQQHASMV